MRGSAVSCLTLSFGLSLTAASAVANDFPTFERVDFVLACMKENGGQNVDNMYSCSCAVDKLAQHFSFEDYNEAAIYERYKAMPGEKGGLFRDSDRGRELVERLETARAEAAKTCFVGRTVKL
jgi:hypothetical protein